MENLKKEYNFLIKRIDNAEKYFRENIEELLNDKNKLHKYVTAVIEIIARIDEIYNTLNDKYYYKMTKEELLNGFKLSIEARMKREEIKI